MVIHCRNHCNSLSKCSLFVPYSITAGLYSSKYQLLLFTVPPAVSALTEHTTTIGENLELAIDMSNLILKYIPQDTLFYRNMSLMQKALYFASALNKGSYGYNCFGNNIVLEDFFEVEGTEPPKKKCM